MQNRAGLPALTFPLRSYRELPAQAPGVAVKVGGSTSEEDERLQQESRCDTVGFFKLAATSAPRWADPDYA